MGVYQNILETADSGATVNLRDGIGTAITSTNVSSKQGLDVNIIGGSFGTVDETPFTYGTSSYTTIGGVFQDTSPTLSAGQGGAARLTSFRGVHMNLRTSGGVELLGQQLMAASVPVVIASNQSAFAVTIGSLGTVAPGTVASNSNLGGLIYNSTPPTFTNGQGGALQGDVSGNLKTNDVNSLALNAKASPATGTPTAVASTATNTSALAANTARKGYLLHNASNKVCYIALGFTTTTTSYSTILMPNGVMSEQQLGTFAGAINVLWPVLGTGSLLVTELT